MAGRAVPPPDPFEGLRVNFGASDRTDITDAKLDTKAKLADATAPSLGVRPDRLTPPTVESGTFRFATSDGPAIEGTMSRVHGRNVLTATSGETFEVRTRGHQTSLHPIERGEDGKYHQVRSREPIRVESGGITVTDAANGLVDRPVKIRGSTGDVFLTGGADITPGKALRLPSESALPGLSFEGGTQTHRKMGLGRNTLVSADLVPESVRGRVKTDANGFVNLAEMSHADRRLTRVALHEAIASGTIARGENGAIVRAGTERSTPIRLEGVLVRNDGWKVDRANNPERFNLLTPVKQQELNQFLEAGGSRRDFWQQQKQIYLAENGSMRGFRDRMFGQNADQAKQIFNAERRFGEQNVDVLRVRDPGKIPGMDGMNGDRFNRNMDAFGRLVNGLKPGDTLDGLLGKMQNNMNARELARLGEFLMSQLGRRGNDALGMQDISRLGATFRGFGDRAGLNLQFGDNRAGIGLTIGLGGRFDLQIRFGGLTLGFGDSRRSGVAQIGQLLFTSDGRATQAGLGTAGLRATDVIARNFSGQNQGNPFFSNTGDSAQQTSKQLTGKLTEGNQQLIKQMAENSAKLTQQMEAAKQAQIANAKFQNIMQQSDFRPNRLDPGGKNQIQQNLDPAQQRNDSISKMQQAGQRAEQGQKAEQGTGKFTLTGNVEMDGRPGPGTAEGMTRRGQFTAASHETNQQNINKGEQIAGSKTQAEKTQSEEEAKKKAEIEDKKKNDLRNDQQFIKEEEERKTKERKEREQEEEELLEDLRDAEDAKRRALLLILQARKKKEQELKEKALKDQVKKQEEAKRAQYRVAVGDSLETIATKQLRNPRLAALIYDINKKVIPIKVLMGREVANLTVGVIINLPSVKEIKEFSSTGFSLGPKFNKIDFTVPAASPQGKTAEQELEAMFGANWHGSDQISVKEDELGTQKSIKEMDEFNKRRQNIENVLGKLGPKRASDGRMRYTVRLGDTLKSIAMKHPSLEDVSAWRLLAELNKLSTETDENDNPKALVTRGSVLVIPTKNEVEEYKKKLGLRKAIAMPGQSVTTGGALPSLKACQSCGKKSLHNVTVCECGSHFTTGSVPYLSDTTGGDAPYLVGGEVTGNPLESTMGSSRKEDRFEAAAKSGHIDGDHWSEIANLEPETRIVKLNSMVDPELEFSLLLLQTQVGGKWLPVAGYEMRENAAVRIDYTDPKHKSSVRIDLPPSAAQDLAKNDLVKNWQNYKRKFINVLAST